MIASFEQELRSLPPLRTTSRTASKHEQIKIKLEQCAHGMEAGTRLPPLRELSALLNATPPTVWRAIKALVAEGVLHTRDRNGIFVSRSPEGSASSPEVAGSNAVARTLTLATKAILPHQQYFWHETLADFHHEHRLIRVRLHNMAARASGPAPVYDLAAEYLPRMGAASVSETELLDLETLMGAAVTRPFRNHVFPARANRFAPFQMSVPCLFVNLRWLKENRLTRPEFGGFTDQCAYIEACLERIARHPPAVPTRFNCHQPLLWLGQRAMDIVALARADNPRTVKADLDRLERDTATALRTWMKARAAEVDSESQPHPFVNGFIEGRAGFYCGFSYDIGRIEAGHPDFAWQATPMLAVDDRAPVMLQCFAVNARTPYPIECIRFIEQALSPASQQRMADCSHVPLDPSRLQADTAPAREACGPEWKALPERMAAIYPEDEVGDYVYHNIMADDLYRCVDKNVPVRAALENMLRHTRTYLTHRG